MNDYQILAWDTEVLGIKTAKILPTKVVQKKLKNILGELKRQNVTLVYWASDSQDMESQQAAEKNKGFLADCKVTYLIDLTKLDKDKIIDTETEIYTESLPNGELIQLALDSGMYSRFKNDPKISQMQFEKVYKLWMASSTKKVIAKAVLVIRKDEKIVAMVTLGEKNNRGDIGLLAVAADCRGMSLGMRLVHAAQKWCLEQEYQFGQVVTQETNFSACRLYEKCGYHIEKVENFYHFWL